MPTRYAAPLAFVLFILIAFSGRHFLHGTAADVWVIAAGVIAMVIVVVIQQIAGFRR